MKDKYFISETFSLDLSEGAVFDTSGRMIGITAYQERFLKYLIQNKNTPCILSNIKEYVYRGEQIPKETPNFFQQLIQLCPAFRERLSVHKVELMDIGYQIMLPKPVTLIGNWKQLIRIKLADICTIDFQQSLIYTDDVKKELTPAQNMLLKVLLRSHDAPLTYQMIIRQSYEYSDGQNHPLRSTHDILTACNELLELIPGIDDLLRPVYLNTVAYMYKGAPHDEHVDSVDVSDQAFPPAPDPACSISGPDFPTKNPTGSNFAASDLTDSGSPTGVPSDTHSERFPSANQLDQNYIYIGNNCYINLVHQITVQYTDHGIEETELTPQMAAFLEVLIINKPLAISKDKLMDEIYGYGEGDTGRLYDLKKRLLLRVPALNGCINTKKGFGYSIQLPKRPEHA